MKIVDVDAVPLDARLSAPFRFGRIVRTTSANVLLRLRTDEGVEGWGEACPVPQLTAETQESIHALVTGGLALQLTGRDPLGRRRLLLDLEPTLARWPFTKAALDTALLDLAGRAMGVPMHALLGGRFRDEVELHGSVGWNEDPAAVAAAARAQGERFAMLKLYAGRGDLDGDLRRIEAAREAVGDGHPFLLDVNGMWTATETIRAAPRLRAAGVVLLEQPVPAYQEDAMAELTRYLAEWHDIDVVADEGVLGPASALRIAARRSARVVNVGLSKLGGPSAAMDTACVAAAGGLDILMGSVVELGIAAAAGLHLAAAVARLPHPGYHMGPLKYAQQISLPPLEPAGGRVPVPSGPGLGIELDLDTIRALDLRRR